MKRLVVDASVVAAAFFPEKHTEAAQALLLSGGDFSAPDLIYAEIANVVLEAPSAQEKSPRRRLSRC